MPFKFSSFFKASDLQVKLAILYVKTPDTQQCQIRDTLCQNP